MSTTTLQAVRATAAEIGVRGNILDHKKFHEVAKHPLGNGLYLRVRKSSSGALLRHWVHRYRVAGQTKRPEDMLGSVLEVTLEEAAEKVDAARAALAKGHHPRGERVTVKVTTTTFREAARALLKKKFGEEEFTGTIDHAVQNKQWYASFESVYPVLGDLPVEQIDQNHVALALEADWHRTPPTARKTRSRVAKVFAAAYANSTRSNPFNPANFETITILLGDNSKSKPKQHFAAMQWNLVPTLIPALQDRRSDALSSVALQVAIRTAKRTSEVILARKDEISIKDRLWVIPAERMKVKEIGGFPLPAHEVPLSPAVIALIEPLMIDTNNPYLFPGRKGGPMVHSVMRNLLVGMGFGPPKKKLGEKTGRQHGEVLDKDRKVRLHFTPHGFRSSFKEWGREQTPKEDDELTELSLAHVYGSEARRAYARNQLTEKRRAVMDRWNDFIDGKSAAPADASNVVPIRRAA